jgi:hypothetical protein
MEQAEVGDAVCNDEQPGQPASGQPLTPSSKKKR